MSILLHAIWPLLEPHLVVEEYDRDGGHVDPRIRIELRDLPPDLAITAADLIMPCVTCGRRIFPFRQRLGSSWADLYYAPTCPLDRNIACSRAAPARDEYDRFKVYKTHRPKILLQLVLI
jgi:hypothetical protein